MITDDVITLDELKKDSKYFVHSSPQTRFPPDLRDVYIEPPQMTYRQWLVGLAMQGDLTNGMPKEQSTIAEFAQVWCMVADAAIKAERETREAAP